MPIVTQQQFEIARKLCCTCVQNYVYAVGGNDGTNSVDSCERFDPVLDKWTMCAVMHFKRAGAGLAELGGSLFVVGAPFSSTRNSSTYSYLWRLSVFWPQVHIKL